MHGGETEFKGLQEVWNFPKGAIKHSKERWLKLGVGRRG